MVGPGDRTSNGSRYDKTPSSPSLTKKQRSKNKMKQCLKCGIPSILVFLAAVGVGITLHHFGMIPKMINIVTPGRWDYVNLCQHHSIIYTWLAVIIKLTRLCTLFPLQKSRLMPPQPRTGNHLLCTTKIWTMWHSVPFDHLTNQQCFAETSKIVPCPPK